MEAGTAKAGEQTGEDEQIQPEPMRGATDQLTLIAGGEAAVTVAEVKLSGGSLVLEGQFELGDEVPLTVLGRVHKVDFVEHRDNTGTVTKVIRRHYVALEHVSRDTQDSLGE